MIITKDEDFARIQRRGGPSVLWLRGANLKRSEFMRKFIEAWPGAYSRLLEGERLVETTFAS